MDSIEPLNLHNKEDSEKNSGSGKRSLKSRLNKLKKYITEDKFIFFGVIVIAILLIGGLINILFANRTNTSNPLPSSSPEVSTQPSSTPESAYKASPSPAVYSASPTPTPSSTPTPSPTSSPTSGSNSTPDSGHSNLSANPTSVPADGSSISSLTVVIRDSNNNPISGNAITLTTSDSKAIFKPAATGSNVTDLSGHATFTITSTNSGSDSINVIATTPGGNSTTLSNLGSVSFTALSTSTPTPTPTPSPSTTP